MKKLSVFLVLVLLAALFTGCQQPDNTPGATTQPTQPTLEHVDYVTRLELNEQSSTKKLEVTVKTFIDGDTTHFHVPTSVSPDGVLKARYLAINTPECTGKIEQYGAKAAAFTREKLESAQSIILESDDEKWNPDSTGERYMVWVWYRTAQDQPYRNLNLELLQNGLAVGSNAGGNRYGSQCKSALSQAMAEKLHVFSGQKDPDFYYGDAIELTLKELRTNLETYKNKKVAFTGVITRDDSNTVYVESQDPETGLYFGIPVYYGYNLSSQGLTILSVGNLVRVVGSVQYYEAGGSWQISDVSYRMMKPDDPSNLQLVSQGHAPAYVPTDADTFANGQVEIVQEDKRETYPYAQLTLGTTLAMDGLVVESVDTTDTPGSSSRGAMTLFCKVGDIPVQVRTAVLYQDGKMVTADAYLGKTISVQGVVEYFIDSYQIKVFSAKDITIE